MLKLFDLKPTKLTEPSFRQNLIRLELLLTIIVFLLPGTSLQATPPTPAAIHWNKPIHVDTGSAYRGRWRMNRSVFRYVDDPSVDIDQNGTVTVGWVRQSSKDIYLQKFDTQGNKILGAPSNVSGTPGVFSWFPRVKVSPHDPDFIYVLWQEIVFSGGTHGGEIFFSRSTDGGESFSDPTNLSGSKAGDGKGRLTEDRWDNGSLDLAVAPDGELYASWTEYEGRLWLSRSTNRGASFSNPKLINIGSDTKPARGPSVTADKNNVFLTWTVGGEPEADLRFIRLNRKGRGYGLPSVVQASNGHSDSPKLEIDNNGLHLAYAESPGGRFGRYHIRYATLGNTSNRFVDDRRISGTIEKGYSSLNYPSLELDGAGNPYVIWERFIHKNRRSRGLGLTYSMDGGDNFVSSFTLPETPGMTDGFNGSQQGKLMEKMSISDDGKIAVVNSTFVPQATSDVWLYVGEIEGE